MQFIASAIGHVESSGTTIDTSSSLNIQAGDLLVALCGFHGDWSNYFVGAVAQTDGETNAMTMLEAANIDMVNFGQLGYRIAATADEAAIFRLTTNYTSSLRTLIVLQFRPTSGATVEFDAGPGTGINQGETSLTSGAISTSGAIAVVVGQHKMWGTSDITDFLIGGVTPDGNINRNRSWVSYRILTEIASNIAYTATAASAMYDVAMILALKETAGISYSVTYSANGGTGSQTDSSSPYAAGSTVTVLGAGTMARTGYSFTGWNTAADGSGTSYVSGDTFAIAANVTLYAQWEVVTHTITYNANGGSGAQSDPSSPYAEGGTVTVLGVGTIARSSYSFVEWNTSPDGSGTAYDPGDTFSMPASNITLYAQWEANPTYAVTYDANGGTGSQADSGSPYESGETVTVLGAGTITRTGYSFVGWNTLANGAGTSYASGATFSMPASSITLYAQWEEFSFLTPASGDRMAETDGLSREAEVIT